uniref:Low-density lipoprotein receptor-related protein 6 (inferred by orthology to a human protein) n=1 Tax=Strongyloides venezuelensis TaxID=75913 RepID=A0A0K0FK26_STRVS
MNPTTDVFFTKLLLVMVILLNTVIFTTSQNFLVSNEESNLSVHFADLSKGRILWILDQNAFPWIGSYSFLKNLDFDNTTLLSVVDSSTGVTLAECNYSNAHSRDNGDEKYVEFVWGLSENVLQCTLPSGSKTISIPLSQHPRSFSVRIQASRGPKCMKSMMVQNEKFESCPPTLRRNGFISHHLSCGCPFEKAEFAPFIPFSTIPSFTGFPVTTTVKPSIENAQFPLFNLNFSNIATKKVDEIEGNTKTNNLPSTFTSPLFNFNHQTTPSTFVFETTKNLPNNGNHQTFIFETKEVTESPLMINTSVITSTTINIPSSTFTLAAHPCASFECQNNGTCVVNSETGLPSCICNIGFIGDKCEIDKCANMKCQNEGICRISKFNFEPFCECKSGTSGSNCEIIEDLEVATQQPECEYECKNGGVCATIANQPLCQCKPGFIGPNCNVVDLCLPESQMCSVFGKEAECRMEDQSFTTVSDTFINGTYNCLCLNSESQWVDCLKLALQKQAEKDTSQGIVTTISSHEEANIQTTNTFNSFNVNQNKNEEEEFNLTEESEITTDSKNSIETTHSTMTEIETTNTDMSKESLPENNIISSIVPTMTTTKEVSLETLEQSTESTKSDEEEEKATKAIDTIPTSISIETTNPPPTTTQFIVPVNRNISEINEEIINSSSDKNSKSTSSASATTWIIVIFIILVIMMLIAGGVLFVLRYIRRSRKLHGKYNPAKEEHAIAATYALPMQAVAKEERLI